MKSNRIWISPSHLGGKELRYIKEALDKNMVTSRGSNITRFEQDIQTYLGEEVEVVAMNSCTAALHLALIILGVRRDDIVMCQDFTYIGTIYPILYLGAKPVLIGSEEKTWNISPYFLEKAIQTYLKKGEKPKVIIWVNVYGMPAQIREIKEIALKYDISLLEDAAQSLGSSYFGRKCGTFGDISVISFNGNKIITTSGGGVLISQNKNSIRHCRFLSAQANDTPYYQYQHSQIGYNYIMSNILAGIGRGQMHVLSQRIRQRRRNNQYYYQCLSHIDGIRFQEEFSSDFFSTYWISTIIFDVEQTKGITNQIIRTELENANIETCLLWKPMHLQPIFADCSYFGDNTDELLFNQGLCLPSGSSLTEKELERIVQIIQKIFTQCLPVKCKKTKYNI